MRKRSIFSGEYGLLLKIGLIVLGLIFIIPIIRNLISWGKNALNLSSAINNASGNAAALNPPAGSSTARALKIKGWAESLNRAFASWWDNKASTVVALLNDTTNAEEIAALSDYYQSTYGKSLLSEVNKEIGSTFNVLGKGWKDLKPYVQKTLY